MSASPIYTDNNPYPFLRVDLHNVYQTPDYAFKIIWCDLRKWPGTAWNNLTPPLAGTNNLVNDWAPVMGGQIPSGAGVQVWQDWSSAQYTQLTGPPIDLALSVKIDRGFPCKRLTVEAACALGALAFITLGLGLRGFASWLDSLWVAPDVLAGMPQPVCTGIATAALPVGTTDIDQKGAIITNSNGLILPDGINAYKDHVVGNFGGMSWNLGSGLGVTDVNNDTAPAAAAIGGIAGNLMNTASQLTCQIGNAVAGQSMNLATTVATLNIPPPFTTAIWRLMLFPQYFDNSVAPAFQIWVAYGGDVNAPFENWSPVIPTGTLAPPPA